MNAVDPDLRGSRVIVGMSGGVDSSVAALLLREQGLRVEGLFMQNWREDDQDCPAAQDLADARAVCAQLEIPLHKVSFAEIYRERVFAHFLEELRRGRTPNPDILCNSEIKFRAFLDHALALGADYIATGHYARVRRDAGGVGLLRGLDPGKDQSYFLHALADAQLARALFPVGELRKPEVRARARAAGLATHAKKDSTGICFIGERPFAEFLSRYLPAQPGEIVTPEGEVLGRHDGLMYYTLGQRHGLGIGGRAGRSEAPWFVAAKETEANRLVVVQGHDHPMLLSEGLIAMGPHWIGEAPTLPLRCTAKVRYRQQDVPCTVTRVAEGLEVRFQTPQRAVTPGQSAVFYAGERCLGGAVIERALPLAAARAAAAEGLVCA
jgi:tRNA-specific 2-thiouridylase